MSRTLKLIIICTLGLWPMLAPAAPSAPSAVDWDYTTRSNESFIIGWIENPYSYTCGMATKEHITDPGYISLYQHNYWLEGRPHKAWNFEIQTAFPNWTSIWVDIFIDGHFFTRYQETMKVDTHAIGSQSDICGDHEGLGSYCPNRSNVGMLDGLIEQLSKAKLLSFHLFNGTKTEIHDLDVSDFPNTHVAIEACLGALAIRLPKD